MIPIEYDKGKEIAERDLSKKFSKNLTGNRGSYSNM